MVDFNKRLTEAPVTNLIDPVQLYETLDRAHDKGPLRPAQTAVLKKWNEEFRQKRDVILKLHTGQGKTLIGLLILQARINEGHGPALYLCPNNFLINQTCDQAKQFGINVCTTDADIPSEFLDGKTIFVTSVQKLFNGRTRFKTGLKSINVETILMDDCHACIGSIRDSFSIKFTHKDVAYEQLLTLFSPSLEMQGAGTFADIKNKSVDALQAVPYWDWLDKQSEVVTILAKHTEDKNLKFVWPVIKNIVGECRCVIAGESLEIAPYLPPLDLFGSYYKASHRVFMSATVTDDSFLVKGLRLSPETIKTPLVYEKERWSGEKMILLPSLIDDTLDRSIIVNTLAKPAKRAYGFVALVPGFRWTKDWESLGAVVANKETIDQEVEKLKTGDRTRALVIANRYDGIDLPDAVCRILVFDSKPFSESLIDRYEESCRSSSEVIAIKTATTIEQGLGRSVRGEKDYCVFILIGTELVRFVRGKQSRGHFSNQTRTQVEIGLEIAEMAKEEIGRGVKPLAALINLINQCLTRDTGWKAFYNEQMESVTPSHASGTALHVFETELLAEKEAQAGNSRNAVDIIQKLLDQHPFDDADRGWYLQEMARYTYAHSKEQANLLQVQAHKLNRFIMRPRVGMTVNQLLVSQQRVDNIIDWVKSHQDCEELSMAVEDIISGLSFGTKADRFEGSFDRLGKALGFSCERPDKEWKEGPDNLWALRDGEYLLVECKSEVHQNRSEIGKQETGQMNNAVAWFAKNYQGATSKNRMIIPTAKMSSATAFGDEVKILRSKEMAKLHANLRSFFREFKLVDFQNLNPERVQQWLGTHGLSTDAIVDNYCVAVRM